MDKKEKERPEILSKQKCVVCYSEEVSPDLYLYKQGEKSRIIRIGNRREKYKFKEEVPTCKVCGKQFYRWESYNLWSNVIYGLGLVTIILGICFLIFYELMGDRGVPLLGVGFLIVIPSLILRYIIGKMKFNPSNYFFYDFLNKIFYIKPKGELDWIFY